RGETAMALSPGARRSRIVRQLLTESTILALGGAAGGTALAWLGVGLARRWGAAILPRALDLHMNLRVFSFVAIVCVAAVLIFGIAPALDRVRGDVAASLKNGRRGSSGSPDSAPARLTPVVLELPPSAQLPISR